MKAQRATLVNKLRESIQNDDIANQLVLSDENEATDIITKELEKYQSTVSCVFTFYSTKTKNKKTFLIFIE